MTIDDYELIPDTGLPDDADYPGEDVMLADIAAAAAEFGIDFFSALTPSSAAAFVEALQAPPPPPCERAVQLARDFVAGSTVDADGTRRFK